MTNNHLYFYSSSVYLVQAKYYMLKRNLFLQIQRVENPELLQKFRAEKAAVSFQMTNTLRPVTRYLFHGTDADACQNICKTGFDQSKARAGCSYGRGIYFACSSQLSDNYTYAKPTGRQPQVAPNPNPSWHPWLSTTVIPNPSLSHFRDDNNFQHMILAEVITGNYKAGFKDLLYTDLCHSVVDNVDSPSMFIVFKSESAYPLYLLTYKSLRRLTPSVFPQTTVVFPKPPVPVVKNPSQPPPPASVLDLFDLA